MRQYNQGLDVLGADIGDILKFIPAVSAISSLTDKGKTPGTPGTATAPSADTQALIKKALEEERARQKAEAEAKKTRTLMYVIIGTMGVAAIGGMALFIRSMRR